MKVGIVGISGAVGAALFELFARHEADSTELLLFGSTRSAGDWQDYQGRRLQVQEFDQQAAATCDVLFLCVSGDFSRKYARALAAEDAIVIDNSSALRYEDDVPLLMPMINAACYRGQRLIANPNCSTAIAALALAPLERQFGIAQAQLATYQAASGAGQAAMTELQRKLQDFRAYGADNYSAYFHYNLAYNVVPHIDAFLPNGYTKEEMKTVWELRKILERPDLPLAATCVRVPTLRSHAIALSLQLQGEVELEQVRQLWQQMPGLKVVDKPEAKCYPMPLFSSRRYAVEVGRLRHSLIPGAAGDKSGLDFFVSGDQLLRGAALNAYEIYCLSQGRELPKEG